MLSSNNSVIGPFPVYNNDSAPSTPDKHSSSAAPQAQYQSKLSSSLESIPETIQDYDIPSPSLSWEYDLETPRLMSLEVPYKQSRQEVVSSASTYCANQLKLDRYSVQSIYKDFHDDLAVDYEYTHQPYQEEHEYCFRPASILPETGREYYHTSYENTTLYSAPLQRKLSHAKRSVTALGLKNLGEALHREETLYEAHRCSSEARPSTPESSLLPSLSFCSSAGASPSSIRTYDSSHNMAQAYGMTEHLEQPRGKKTKAPPERLALNARARNISSPIPSPKFPDVHTAAATSYHRTPYSTSFAPTPSPAPTSTPVEVSKFDDSDDEEGKFSYQVKKIKSVVSLQNFHGRSRARAESSSRTPPPLPTALVPTSGSTSGGSVQRNSKDSIKARNSKESDKSTRSTRAATAPVSPPITSNGTAQIPHYSATTNHNMASSEAKPASPVARLQKISVRSNRSRSNTASSASSPPTPPPNTPISPTPKLTVDRDKRHSRMSWYSCFSHPEITEATSYITAQQKKMKRNSKASRKSTRVASLGRVRVFFRRLFMLRR